MSQYYREILVWLPWISCYLVRFAAVKTSLMREIQPVRYLRVTERTEPLADILWLRNNWQIFRDGELADILCSFLPPFRWCTIDKRMSARLIHSILFKTGLFAKSIPTQLELFAPLLVHQGYRSSLIHSIHLHDELRVTNCNFYFTAALFSFYLTNSSLLFVIPALGFAIAGSTKFTKNYELHICKDLLEKWDSSDADSPPVSAKV